MRPVIITTVFLLLCHQLASAQVQRQKDRSFFPANHPMIQYTGRIDFTDPWLPVFWQPGVYIDIAFEGESCAIILQDEILYGTKHNYIELVLDGKPGRLQTKSKRDTIVVAEHAGAGKHLLQLVKNTEANIGYLAFVGVLCEKLVAPAARPSRKIECIGNSITCGTGADQSQIPCGAGVWEDQHNAYVSYGAVTARNLDAQYHLASVSGIGLMRSCCHMDITMPQVFDKIHMRNDSIRWDFSLYQPDVVTICLGQNDGLQDSAGFCDRYLSFIRQVRSFYPKAQIVCLSSPMADATLTLYMQRMLKSIVQRSRDEKENQVSFYFFSRQYHHGCDSHPNVEEHQMIADELTNYLRKLMGW